MTLKEKFDLLAEYYGIINANLEYLDGTDWVVIKALETHTEVPTEVLNERAVCRTEINEYERLVSQLERIVCVDEDGYDVVPE